MTRKKFDSLWTTLPAIGEVFTPNGEYLIEFEEENLAYCCLKVYGTYPDSEPRREIAGTSKGLRVFFNKKSRDKLQAAKNFITFATTNRSFKIIGHFQSKKSVQAELI